MLRLIDEANRGTLRSTTKHTLDQAVERLIWRKQSLAGMGNHGTSYIWWWFAFDEGELSIEYSPSSLSEIGYDNGSYRYVSMNSDSFGVETLVQDWLPDRPVSLDPLLPFETAMLKMGVQPYQKCLSAYTESWSRSYEGEAEADIECELLYVEPSHNVLYLPIVIDEAMCLSQTKGVTIA
jgi:hypothetical protein